MIGPRTGTTVRPRTGPCPGHPQRTSLRALRATDASNLDWLLHPDVRRYLPDAPRTAERLARYTSWAERQAAVTRQLSLAVLVGDQPVGIIQGWAAEPTSRVIEWGFALARPRWGEGLLQESGRAFLAHAFRLLGVDRIEARTALANARAITALQRLGARSEGVIVRGLADNTTDCVLWSIGADDVTRPSPADGGEARLWLPSQQLPATPSELRA